MKESILKGWHWLFMKRLAIDGGGGKKGGGECYANHEQKKKTKLHHEHQYTL